MALPHDEGRWQDGRLPLPKPGDNQQLPESARAARREPPETLGEQLTRLGYEAGLPRAAVLLLKQILVPLELRVEALEGHGCPCPDAHNTEENK